MIIKLEKFIENSGLEMIWVLRFITFSFALQIFIFLILFISQSVLVNANFKLSHTFINTLDIVFYSIFSSIFLYSIIKNREISDFLKSLFRFFFFLIITNTFLIFSAGEFIIPSKYKNWESFILVDHSVLDEEKESRISYIKKFLNKIFK